MQFTINKEKLMTQPIQVTVWNEFRHEKTNEFIRGIYPNGIHAAIADGLDKTGGFKVRSATLDEPEHGFTDDVLSTTNVHIWWGHAAPGAVEDDISSKVRARV